MRTLLLHKYRRIRSCGWCVESSTLKQPKMVSTISLKERMECQNLLAYYAWCTHGPMRGLVTTFPGGLQLSRSNEQLCFRVRYFVGGGCCSAIPYLPYFNAQRVIHTICLPSGGQFLWYGKLSLVVTSFAEQQVHNYQSRSTGSDLQAWFNNPPRGKAGRSALAKELNNDASTGRFV